MTDLSTIVNFAVLGHAKRNNTDNVMVDDIYLYIENKYEGKQQSAIADFL